MKQTEERTMVVFVCEDSPEGIFTGVYDAWNSRLGHENVRLEVQGEYNYSLFSEYREVAVDRLKGTEQGSVRALGAPIPVRTGVQLDLPHGAE